MSVATERWHEANGVTMDTAQSESRVKALTLRICVDHGVNATIKFGKSRRTAGSQTMYTKSHVHVVTFSRLQLADYERGQPWHPGYECTRHLWSRYRKLFGWDAEWALVLHEMAHAIDCERSSGVYGDRANGASGRGQKQYHLAEFQAIVRELQAQYPPPDIQTQGAVALPLLDFSNVPPPAVWVEPKEVR